MSRIGKMLRLRLSGTENFLQWRLHRPIVKVRIYTLVELADSCNKEQDRKKLHITPVALADSRNDATLVSPGEVRALPHEASPFPGLQEGPRLVLSVPWVMLGGMCPRTDLSLC